MNFYSDLYERFREGVAGVAPSLFCTHRLSAILIGVAPKNPQAATSVGLCARCVFMREIRSDRGSTFYMCQRSATDPSFPKYPRLPLLQCRGYEASLKKDK